MRMIWASCLTGFSLALASCQSGPTLRDDALCTLRTIEVSEETRDHLRGPLERDTGLPAGYARFLRELAAHNEKIRAHCAAIGTSPG